MESTVSVSKGVFVFSNGYKANVYKRKPGPDLFEKLHKELWYRTYKNNWELIENELEDLNHKTYGILLNNIVGYLKEAYKDDDTILDGIVPCATLLTGISQPDHVSQFSALINMIKKEVTQHVAIVSSQDASTVKHLVENAVWQLQQSSELDIPLDKYSLSQPKQKKSSCSLKSLQNWYQSQYIVTSLRNKYRTVDKDALVIIIPDFESFNCSVLQDFVLIVSSYVPALPIVLVFGVATSVSALHKSFPYHVSSKLLIKVFHTHSSPVYMSEILENTFLTHKSAFHLSGKCLELLTDVFLFYDFSVTGLIQSIKYCMMEHYYGDNLKSLCCGKDNVRQAILKLNSEDLENIRQLLSFRPFLEKQDCRNKIKLFEDDDYLKTILCEEMTRLYEYLHSFYLCVRLLCTFVKDMPKNIMGKSVREIYTKCAMECITNTPAFKESMQLLGFQSKAKLTENIKFALKVVDSYLQIASPAKDHLPIPTNNSTTDVQLKGDLGENFANKIRVHLLMFLRQIENANTEATTITNNAEPEDHVENTPESRYELKEKLLKATKADKIQSEFEMLRSRFLSYLEEVFVKGLEPPHAQPFHEILFFSEVSSVKKQIVGSPRGALHTALSNPAHYLQCSCCHLPSADSVVGSLPDVCLAYKLYRECGKHINLYDWLQAFASVLAPEEDEQRHQDPALQLRFTRAVAELQFLGFIKSSKRKTDHVMRLT